jgi:hypothetical protein
MLILGCQSSAYQNLASFRVVVNVEIRLVPPNLEHSGLALTGLSIDVNDILSVLVVLNPITRTKNGHSTNTPE